jgi:hypothetical protein
MRGLQGRDAASALLSKEHDRSGIPLFSPFPSCLILGVQKRNGGETPP